MVVRVKRRHALEFFRRDHGHEIVHFGSHVHRANARRNGNRGNEAVRSFPSHRSRCRAKTGAGDESIIHENHRASAQLRLYDARGQHAERRSERVRHLARDRNAAARQSEHDDVCLRREEAQRKRQYLTGIGAIAKLRTNREVHRL
jgi:hypothetical protein